MFEKFKELEDWTKILILVGAFCVVALMIYIGVDPVDDFAGLN